MVDDIPLGSATTGGYGFLIPDIDPGDLARIEVLRGPQGTLYGASSMGGLIKYVTVDPSTDGVSGRFQSGTSIVQNGNGLGYNLRGSVNIPLSNTFAVRASVFTRHDPGYIDNVQSGQQGVNYVDSAGGRLSALWRPSANFSVKLGALIQNDKDHGYGYVTVQPGLGDLQQSFLKGTGGSNQKFQIFSATMDAKLGPIDLTSVSGYTINTASVTDDLSSGFFGGFATANFGVAGASIFEPENKIKKFTQEIRLSSSWGDHWDWMLGAFYTDERITQSQVIIAVDPETGLASPMGTPAGEIAKFVFPSTYSEHAAFADVTYHCRFP